MKQESRGNEIKLNVMKNTKIQLNKIRNFQNNLYMAAKNSPNRRFAVLYDKVYRMDILILAWQKVRTGGKASGIDKITVKYIEEEYGCEKLMQEIQNELVEFSYKPEKVRRTYIPKENGKTRPLGIPTVKDKVIQMAVKIVIEPLFECDFTENSYGFRPQRSNKQAANAVHKIINKNKWIVDVDLSSYFDTIDHEMLLDKVRLRVTDKRVIHLIRMWLKAGILEPNDETIYPELGTPQGGVLSPLLSNIYLHSIDKAWQYNSSVKTVRFADDMVFMCVSERQARFVLKRLKEQLGSLKLILNEEKTKICHVRDGFKFLGFEYKEAYSYKWKKWVRIKFPQPKRVISFQRRIKEYIKEIKLGTSLNEVIKGVNRKLKGWAEYYKIGNSYVASLKIMNYACKQLRLYWRRCKHRKDIQGTRKWKNSYFYQQNLLYIPKLIKY